MSRAFFPRCVALLLPAVCLVSAQGPAPADLPGAPGPGLAVDTRFTGTPTDAMAAIRGLSADEPERAARIARELGDDESLAEPLRAEFRFAEGVVRAGMGAPAAAIDPFLSARALAGPGELRAAATYDQGTAQLLLAETLREEAFRSMMDPAAAGAPSGVDAKDPLAKPRAAYLRAKETLLQRLRAAGTAGDATAGDATADGTTGDTRANLELIQRRLRELDQLQKDQQDDQQQSDDQQQGEQSEQEDGDQQQSEGEKGDQQPEDDSQRNSGDEGDQNEEQQGSASEPDPNAPPQDQGPRDSGELPEVTETPVSPDAQPAERLLSREEVLRLLDTLESLEGERDAIEAQLRAVRRVPVEEDW